MSTALLIIDVQATLFSGDYEVADAPAVLERLNGLIERARRAGQPVVFVQHEEAEGPMQHGSAGWALASGLDAAAGDPRVRKTTPDAFLRTELRSLLQVLGVRRLVVGGAQTDLCVDSSVRSALALGFDVSVASDAHSTLDTPALDAARIRAHHNLTWSQLGYGPAIEVRPAAELGFGG